MAKQRPEARKVLVADDDETILDFIAETLSETEFEVVKARTGKEALAQVNEDFVVAIIDLNMPEPSGIACLKHLQKHFPDIQTIICTGSSEVSDAVTAMKHGAFEYLTKPVNPDELVELVNRAAETSLLIQENRQLRHALGTPNVRASLIGSSPATRTLLRNAEKIAPLESTVMLTGESGVGKGLLARIIHRMSRRQNGPFVTVSCTALPRDLVEAELFGHEKGAFTGAHEKRPGRVEMAAGGTLFLDEVGDMPIDLQPKLLTFLQDRAFQRIGGNRTISVDLRVIAATHQDLKTMCAEKRFREDLYFRLNVLPIAIPPLRERREDIADLTQFLLAAIADRRAVRPHVVDNAAMELLTRYSWPGNVRELENVLERATAFCEGDRVGVADLPPELHQADHAPPRATASLGGMKLEEIEKIALVQTLDLCQGNKSKAARYLGISEKSVYNKMKRLGLS